MSDEIDTSKLLHRDDLPMDEAEAIVDDLQKQFPGFKVVFAGDHQGEMPEGLKQAVEELNQQHANSMRTGACIDCGAVMPGYAEIIESESEFAPGWKLFESTNGEPLAWQCPECDAKEEAENANG